MRLIGQRWPNLERLDLALQQATSGNLLATPDKKCRDLMSSLMPLTRLQHLTLSIGAALLPEGQELMLRQTRLLSLRIPVDWLPAVGLIGASDGLLQVIGRLSHLTRLQYYLQADLALLAGTLPPFQLEPVTDEGVRCLSSLQSLKDLNLTGQAFHWMDSTITGQSLRSIGSLHQLTHLSLERWPMVDTDLGHLTHMQLKSLSSYTCMNLTIGCAMHLSKMTSLHLPAHDPRRRLVLGG